MTVTTQGERAPAWGASENGAPPREPWITCVRDRLVCDCGASAPMASAASFLIEHERCGEMVV